MRLQPGCEQGNGEQWEKAGLKNDDFCGPCQWAWILHLFVSLASKSALIKADAQYVLMVHETKTEDKQTSMAEEILTN